MKWSCSLQSFSCCCHQFSAVDIQYSLVPLVIVMCIMLWGRQQQFGPLPIIMLCNIDPLISSSQYMYDAVVEMFRYSFQYIQPFNSCSRGLLELCDCPQRSTTRGGSRRKYLEGQYPPPWNRNVYICACQFVVKCSWLQLSLFHLEGFLKWTFGGKAQVWGQWPPALT